MPDIYENDEFDEDFDEDENNVLVSPGRRRQRKIDASDADRFFGKIFFNVLATVNNNSVGNAFFLRDLRGYPGALAGTWLEYVDEIENAFLEANKDRKYVMTSDFLTKEHFRHIVDSIRTEHPWVGNDFEVGANAALLSDMLDLDHIEKIILELALRVYDLPYPIRDVLEELSWDEENKEKVKLYSRILGFPEPSVRKSLKGFLFQSGFLIDSDNLRCFHVVNEEMAELFDSVQLTPETLELHLFPNNLSTELTVDSFPHLAKEIGICEKIVNKAVQDGSRGINVMLFGVPGTGKTELALVLARRNGWDLKVVGDIGDGDTQEKSRAQRLTSLKIALKLYARSDNVVLLFDEMEDLFKDNPEAIGFTLCPMTVEQLCNASDNGINLPPKSTWIDPKIPYGLLLYKHE